MVRSSEENARALESTGDYRVLRRLDNRTEYRPADDLPKSVAMVVDTETTGIDVQRDKIIELGISLFEYEKNAGKLYKMLGSWSWLEDPGVEIPPTVMKLTGISSDMVAGRQIDQSAVLDLLGRADIVIAHNAAFDRPILERRIGPFSSKPWGCTKSDIDWAGEGISSTKLDYIAYRLGFFFDGHRALSDCHATAHVLAQDLPSSGTPILRSLLERARAVTWRVWARGSEFEARSPLKERGYIWSAGEFGRPRCWYRDVEEARFDAETAWLRTNIVGADRSIWAHRITAWDRYSERAYEWGKSFSGAVGG